MFRKVALLTIAILAIAIALPTVAQDAPPALPENAEVVAEGLNYPRGLFVADDGALYIAEPGMGGDQVVSAEEGAAATAGLSGQVTVVGVDGEVSAAWDNVPSVFSEAEGAALGVYRAYPQGDSLWVVMSDVPGLALSGTVLELDSTTLRIKNMIDLVAYENANNTDGTDEVLSNPGDIAWDANGTLYIVDTGANSLFTWSPEAGLTPFIVWNDNPVPTSIEFAADGSLYVGFLGTEIAPGAGHIEHWSADGQTLIETFSNLNAVTDIEVAADGSVYAVQLITGFGEQGPLPGNIVEITTEGATPVVENLMTPFSLDTDAAGNLYVSTGTTFTGPGAGSVLKINVAA